MTLSIRVTVTQPVGKLTTAGAMMKRNATRPANPEMTAATAKPASSVIWQSRLGQLLRLVPFCEASRLEANGEPLKFGAWEGSARANGEYRASKRRELRAGAPRRIALRAGVAWSRRYTGRSDFDG